MSTIVKDKPRKKMDKIGQHREELGQIKMNVEPTKYECGYCDYESDRPHLAERHQASADDQFQQFGSLEWPCSDCKKVYCFRASLASHKCDAKPDQPKVLRPEHEPHVSSPEKEFACKYCDHSADSSTQLQRHEDTGEQIWAAGQGPVTCRSCDNSYCTQSAMDFHHCRKTAGRSPRRRSVISSTTNTDDEGIEAPDELGESDFEYEEDQLRTQEEQRRWCQYCSFSSCLPRVVLRHEKAAEILRQQGKGRHGCYECGNSYCTRQALLLHSCNDIAKPKEARSTNTRGEQGGLTTGRRKMHYCKHCSYEARWARVLVHEKHAESLRLRGIMPRLCKQCGNTYCSEQATAGHRCQTGEQSNPQANHPEGLSAEDGHCHRCNFRTDDREVERQHRSIAERLERAGLSPAHCSTCDKSYCGRDAFQLHLCDTGVSPDTPKRQRQVNFERNDGRNKRSKVDESSSRGEIDNSIRLGKVVREPIISNPDLSFTAEELSRITVALSMRNTTAEDVNMPFEDCETLSGLLKEVAEGPYYCVLAVEDIRAIWLQAGNGPDDSKLHLRPSKSQSSDSYRKFLAMEVKRRLVEDEKAVVVISASIEVLKWMVDG